MQKKKFFVSLAVMFAIFCVNFSAFAAKKIVAVMPMENVSGYNASNVAQIMTEQLINVIHNSGQYGVIETTQMGAVMKQQGFENLVGSQEVDFGNKSNSDFTVVGKVIMATTTQNQTKNLISSLFNPNKQGGLVGGLINSANSRKAKVELEVRFVDNKSGEVIFSKTFSGSKSGQNDAIALSGACRVAAENFLKELQETNPFVARIEDISGNEIYIDQGLESGIKKGEKLVVARESAPITVKGKIVGMKDTEICKATVTEVNSDYSVCKVDKVSQVKKGDIVRREKK